MGKKAKQATEIPIARERMTEADYYARRCGLTRDEALRIMRKACAPGAIVDGKHHQKGS
ncbi:conserved hypothetical protein [Mesorhizobium sp. ORS 3324]|nr:conserved hypothetical protein [Mesorhizobium sp. ORS 3324]